MAQNSEICITEDEAQLYDRQIRLWGLDAQKRLRGARYYFSYKNSPIIKRFNFFLNEAKPWNYTLFLVISLLYIEKFELEFNK